MLVTHAQSTRRKSSYIPSLAGFLACSSSPRHLPRVCWGDILPYVLQWSMSPSAPLMETYSCGTARDSHPIPLSNRISVQSYAFISELQRDCQHFFHYTVSFGLYSHVHFPWFSIKFLFVSLTFARRNEQDATPLLPKKSKVISSKKRYHHNAN